MNNFETSDPIPPEFHEYYYELCALATSGALADKEWIELKAHVARCRDCRQRLQEYREIARTGMAALMPDRTEDHSEATRCWSPEAARKELLARIARGGRTIEAQRRLKIARESWIGWLWQWPILGLPRPGYAYAAVAVLVIALGASAYRLGSRRGFELASTQVQSSVADENALRHENEALRKERDAMAADTAARSFELQLFKRELQRQAAEVEKWKALQARTSDDLRQKWGSVASLQSELSAAVAQREDISRKLAASEAELRDLQVRYDGLRQQHSQALLRTASLETRIEDLASRLKQSEAEVSRHEEFLASDRDIRELMGARELYIADVFDVDVAGEKRKPYGRIFYTKNKSLIFYAFDLDQQDQLRHAAIFQAWGRHGMGDKRPVNMGIFYLDSQANKRWVLKFDDPKALAQIDAIFVTVEPRGGSQKPSGKQLLYASLRTMPNHP